MGRLRLELQARVQFALRVNGHRSAHLSAINAKLVITLVPVVLYVRPAQLAPIPVPVPVLALFVVLVLFLPMQLQVVALLAIRVWFPRRAHHSAQHALGAFRLIITKVNKLAVLVQLDNLA